MEAKIVEKGAFKIVGLRKMFTHATAKEIPALWNSFFPHVKSITGKDEVDIYYGACYHDPANPITEESEFEQIAAIDFIEGYEIPEGMIVRDVEAAKYAVFTHKGKLDTLTETYNYIYGVWAKRDDVKLAAGHMFEYYDELFKHDQDDSEMFIYVPIE